MTATKPRPLPTPSAWSQPFWDAVARSELTVQQCRSCEKLIMYPKRVCPFCLGDDLGWVPSNGTGEIYTLSVQHAGPPSGFENLVPYVLIVVRLDEGVQLMSNLVGDGALEARCGDRVAVDFDEVGDGVTLPVFRLTPAS